MSRAQEAALPPGYEEVIASTRYPVLRTPSQDPDVIPGDATSDAGRPWRLRFVDFTPHLAGNDVRRNPTSFGKLVDRANAWLQINKHVDVITCETITWSAEDLPGLNNTDVITCKLKRGNIKKLFYMRGLRIWVTPHQNSSNEPVTIGIREFIPEITDVKSLEKFNIKALMTLANNKIWQSPIRGHVISIETVLQPTKSEVKDKLPLKVKNTYWTDGAKVVRKYIPILRVYYALGDRETNIEIGTVDMVPRATRHDGRYRQEDLESLMIRVNSWIRNQVNTSVTNIQTVTYRRRGFSQGVGFPVFWASPDSEDAGVRCMRVCYTKPRAALALRVSRPSAVILRKRTFAPRCSPLAIDENTTAAADSRFQSFTRTVEEVSQWIDQTDMAILGVETLRHQIVDGRYLSAPDSSLVRPSDEKTREFATLVRIYIKSKNELSYRLHGGASIFNNSEDRPFDGISHQATLARRKRARLWSHVILIVVIVVAIIIVAVVIAFVLGIARGWL